MTRGGCVAHRSYTYRKKVDAEIAMIQRLKELQLRVVALIGTALLSLMVGVSNYLSRVYYDSMHGDGVIGAEQQL